MQINKILEKVDEITKPFSEKIFSTKYTNFKNIAPFKANLLNKILKQLILIYKTLSSMIF